MSNVWPVSLTRAPRVADLSEGTPLLAIRSQMDVGPAITRRRTTAAVRVFKVGLDLTRAELVTFDAFFVDTLAGGALPFEWTHPRTGAVAEFRIVDQPEYRPRGPRTADATSEWWSVSFSMELLPTAAAGSPPPPPPPPPDMPGWFVVRAGDDMVAMQEEEEPSSTVGPFYEGPVIVTDPVPPLYYVVAAGDDAGDGDDGGGTDAAGAALAATQSNSTGAPGGSFDTIIPGLEP